MAESPTDKLRDPNLAGQSRHDNADGKSHDGKGHDGKGHGGKGSWEATSTLSLDPAWAPELAVALAAAEAGARVLRRYFRADDLEIQEKQANDLVSKADRESEQEILGVLRRAFPDHRILAEESGRLDPLAQPGDRQLPSRGANAETDREDCREVGEWIVDPLDGTANFLQGLPVFCISIGYRVQGRMAVGVILDPMGENVFSATLGGGAHWNGEPMRVSRKLGLEGAFLATGYPFRAKKALDLYLDLFRDIFFRSRGIRRCGAAALDLAYTAAGVYDGFFEFRLSPWDLAAGSLLITEAGGLVTNLEGGPDFFAGGNVLAGPPGLHAELLEAVGEKVDEKGLDRISPR